MDLRHHKWAKQDQKRKTLTGPRLGALFLFLIFFGFFAALTRDGFDAVSLLFMLFWLPTGYLAFFSSDDTVESCFDFLSPFSMW